MIIVPQKLNECHPTCLIFPLQKLQADRIILQKRKDTFKRNLKQLNNVYETLKSTLNDNETYMQVGCHMNKLC